MKKLLLIPVMLLAVTLFSGTAFAKIGNVVDLIDNGAGKLGKTPSGLLNAKGIQKQIPLEIFNVTASSTSASSTVITWGTNKEADGYVTYWESASSSSTTVPLVKLSSTTSTTHEIQLTDLVASTTYSYFVTSEDLYGNSTSSDTYAFVFDGMEELRCSEGLLSSSACDGVLAIFEATGGSSRNGGLIPRPIDSTRAVLVYGLKNFTDSGVPFSMIASSSIGLGYRLEPGQTPTYDLDASNTPEFPDFVSYMTNGVDENLDAGGIMYTPDGTLITASAGGNWESSEYRFNGNPDLQGKKINFVRFIITRNNTYDAGSGGIGNELEYIVEIWGEDMPDDLQGPWITDLSITPTTTVSGGEITFNVTAEDVNGIGNIIYDIRYPNGTYVLRPNCNFFGSTSGTCSFTESIDHGISPALVGDYVIESVRASDNYGNISTYYPNGTVTGAKQATHSLDIPVIQTTPTI